MGRGGGISASPLSPIPWVSINPRWQLEHRSARYYHMNVSQLIIQLCLGLLSHTYIRGRARAFENLIFTFKLSVSTWTTPSDLKRPIASITCSRTYKVNSVLSARFSLCKFNSTLRFDVHMMLINHVEISLFAESKSSFSDVYHPGKSRRDGKITFILTRHSGL